MLSTTLDLIRIVRTASLTLGLLKRKCYILPAAQKGIHRRKPMSTKSTFLI